MIVFLAFVRTASIGLLCLLVGLIVYVLIVWLSGQFEHDLSSDAMSWIFVSCMVSAWACYRLFFRQVWRKEGDEWVQE
jgi:hypothetical protein